MCRGPDIRTSGNDADVRTSGRRTTCGGRRQPGGVAAEDVEEHRSRQRAQEARRHRRAVAAGAVHDDRLLEVELGGPAAQVGEGDDLRTGDGPERHLAGVADVDELDGDLGRRRASSWATVERTAARTTSGRSASAGAPPSSAPTTSSNWMPGFRGAASPRPRRRGRSRAPGRCRGHDGADVLGVAAVDADVHRADEVAGAEFEHLARVSTTTAPTAWSSTSSRDRARAVARCPSARARTC